MQMNGIKLLNRTDTKYVFNIKSLRAVLEAIAKDYRILTIDGKNIFNYETLYYDTEDSDMFSLHHNGKLNRHKIRKRDYIESDLRFIEIKFKNNKGRTIKKRIETDSLSCPLSKKEKAFITKNSPYLPEQLEHKLYTAFKRFTLADNQKSERITVDFDLHFRDYSNSKALPNICIMEIKQDKRKKDSKITETLRALKLQTGSMSKYCFATTLLNDKIKKNNFKPTLLRLEKLANA